MNVKKLLVDALEPVGLPVYATVYEGREDQFVVFILESETPEICGDDEQETELCQIQVHYFCRGDTTEKKKQLRRILREADFTVTDTTELYEKDTRYHHVIISAEIAGAIDD